MTGQRLPVGEMGEVALGTGVRAGGGEALVPIVDDAADELTVGERRELPVGAPVVHAVGDALADD